MIKKYDSLQQIGSLTELSLINQQTIQWKEGKGNCVIVAQPDMINWIETWEFLRSD